MNLNYSFFLFFILFSIILSVLIITLSWSLGEKNPYKDKVSVYECGFNPFHSPGQPFSIKFFVIGILFLIFDLEIAFLFPWSCSTNNINISGQTIIIIFLITLVIGLIYEWVKGGLEWE